MHSYVAPLEPLGRCEPAVVARWTVSPGTCTVLDFTVLPAFYVLQVFDYDRMCPNDDLLGTTEVYPNTRIGLYCIVLYCLSFLSVLQVFDYDRMCPNDDLLGTTEVYFSDERVEVETVGQDLVAEKVSGRNPAVGWLSLLFVW